MCPLISCMEDDLPFDRLWPAYVSQLRAHYRTKQFVDVMEILSKFYRDLYHEKTNKPLKFDIPQFWICAV